MAEHIWLYVSSEAYYVCKTCKYIIPKGILLDNMGEDELYRDCLNRLAQYHGKECHGEE